MARVGWQPARGAGVVTVLLLLVLVIAGCSGQTGAEVADAAAAV